MCMRETESKGRNEDLHKANNKIYSLEVPHDDTAHIPIAFKVFYTI